MEDLGTFKDRLEGAELKSFKWQPVLVVIYGSHLRLKSLNAIYQY